MYSFCWFNSFTIYLSAIFVWVLHVCQWEPDCTQQWYIVFLIHKLLPHWSDLLICSFVNWSEEGSEYFFHFQLLLGSMSPISLVIQCSIPHLGWFYICSHKWSEQVSLRWKSNLLPSSPFHAILCAQTIECLHLVCSSPLRWKFYLFG